MQDIAPHDGDHKYEKTSFRLKGGAAVVVVIFYLSDMGEDCYIVSHFTNNGVHS